MTTLNITPQQAQRIADGDTELRVLMDKQPTNEHTTGATHDPDPPWKYAGCDLLPEDGGWWVWCYTDPYWHSKHPMGHPFRCPYGKPGDEVYIRWGPPPPSPCEPDPETQECECRFYYHLRTLSDVQVEQDPDGWHWVLRWS